MSKNIVIVESPAKAKTIEKFLGKDFKVLSSYGHIRDLVKKDFGVDIENDYQPVYEVLDDKKKIVRELKKQVKDADMIYLASDEDREGEAIAWHLFETLKLNNKTSKRIVFNEITKPAISKAVKNPGSINLNLVDAQQARRVLDRLVGFKLSSVLWKKVQSSLSAGRVQSVAVRLLVDREREILEFVPESSFKAGIKVSPESDRKQAFEAKYKPALDDEKSALELFKEIQGKDYIITEIEKKKGTRSPAPPFTTSSLQQQAAGKLGFSVSKTMRTAQRLYEGGYITYMRTDSTNLSKTALDSAEDEIKKTYGDDYYHRRTFKTKSKGAQEAHEAIRPTDMKRKSAGSNSDEKRLYSLIQKRALASQMSAAVFEKTKVIINAKDTKRDFEANGEILVFDGFLKAYYADSKEIVKNSDFLPPLKKNQKLDFIGGEAREVFTKHPPRYSEAALVKKMEDLGIGRPSTYAPTISTLQNRGYVLIEDRAGTDRTYRHIRLSDKITVSDKTEISGTEKSKMFPTDTAMVVTDFLIKHFLNIVDYNFTAKVEEDFDEIAAGKMVWNKMIDDFYTDFDQQVQKTIKEADKNTGERILGEHPETGKRVSVRLGKYGPVVQHGSPDDEDKPNYVSLQKDQFLETITFEEALELLKSSGNGRYLGDDPETGEKVFVRVARYGPVVQRGDGSGKEKPKYVSLLPGMDVNSVDLDQALALLSLPRDLGKYEDKKVVTAIGRFGPYVRHDGKFASLKKTDSPLSIELDRAIELIEEKREKDRKRQIKVFPENEDIKIIKDRWKRPCIYHNKKYYNISSIEKPEKLTLEECKKIIEQEEGKAPKKKPTKKKTAAKKKTTSKKKTTGKKGSGKKKK